MKHENTYYKGPIMGEMNYKEEAMYNMFNDYDTSYEYRKVINEVDKVIKHRCDINRRKTNNKK